MPKPEWGTKRICLSCGARFYDFAKTTIACPACDAAFDAEAVNRVRRTRTAVRATAPAPEIEEPEAEEAAVEEDEDEEEEEAAHVDDEVPTKVVADEEDDEEEDESPIEDASELGGDDVADVIDGDLDEDEST